MSVSVCVCVMSSCTEACPAGRTTLLILRCDADAGTTSDAGTAAGSVVGVRAELSVSCVCLSVCPVVLRRVPLVVRLY